MNSNLTNPDCPTPRGVWSLVPVLIIIAAALAYYGSYWHYWFNPHDEGGTVCLIAQRLLQGERPWVDVEPGYNIGWFYPLVALFKLTGVNYLAARAWFFALSTITALLGFFVVKRVTGSRWAGLGVGLALVAFPGSQFKNYIPLAAAANTACLILLVHVHPLARAKWWGATALGGVVLGLTFLVRVELGFFFTVIWALLLMLALLDGRLGSLKRLGAVITGAVALVGGVVVAQAPVYFDLRGRGLEKEFVAEYSGWLQFLEASFKQEFLSATPPVRAAVPPSAAAPAPETTLPAISPKPQHNDGVDRSTLSRKPLSAITAGPVRDGMLAFLSYAPLLGFAIFLLAGAWGFLCSLLRGEFTLENAPLMRLLLVGGSLTTFPQFFFFRPDRPHLSEFMVGYIIATVAGAWMLWPRGPERPTAQRFVAGLVAFFLAVQLTVFAVFALQHPSAGTIAARFGRKAWFKGENGVPVRDFKRQATTLQGVYDAVMKASGPKDYVICFPYMPGYNVMTNRPTYLRNVYVDNATRGERWAQETIRDFEEKKPAVVIIDDRAINGTDPSRFSRWGASVVDYLKEHYTSAGKFETVEVFVKPATP